MKLSGKESELTNLAMLEMNKNTGNYLPLENLFAAFLDHHDQVLT